MSWWMLMNYFVKNKITKQDINKSFDNATKPKEKYIEEEQR